MTGQLTLLILARWAHILAAVMLAGGTIFTAFVLLPAAGDALSSEQADALRDRMMRRWRGAVTTCIGLLLISGAYNFLVIAMPKARGFPLYHALFGIKILAALLIFFIASALGGRSPAFAGMRARFKTWMTVTALLAVLVILISGVLKNLPPAN
jgi:uncharacterized membrane protein